jgi:hypothetical protein
MVDCESIKKNANGYNRYQAQIIEHSLTANAVLGLRPCAYGEPMYR